MKTTTRSQKPEARSRKSAFRITDHASRITDHASRITHHRPRAFTLIELLVVISVIGVLAALTFPAVSGVKLMVMRARAKAELVQLETAIERFNHKLGYYPPDNPGNWAVPPLYYELLGTTNDGVYFRTLDDSAQIPVAVLALGATPFGPNITGFVNCSRPGKGDDLPGAMAFAKGFKPNQFMAITNGVFPTPCSVLGSGIPGPLVYESILGAKLNPWRYNSSSPRYNTKSYDLWIDVMAGDKTNRICNWSEKAITVSTEY
jgi:prepilin-type N-terminal cleavage/methylation domain-containing protein